MPFITFIAALSVLVFVLALTMRARRIRLPRSLVVQYAPLPSATVFEDAILAGQERRAPTAALLDLVVRRRVRLLVEREGDRRTSVGVELVAGVEPTPDEAALLDAVTGRAKDGRRVRRLTRDRRDLGRALRALVDKRAERLQRRGLLNGHSPLRPILRVLSFGLAAFAALIGLLAILTAIVGTGSGLGVLVAFLAAGLAGAACLLTPRAPARRFTPAAQEARIHLDGIRQYLLVAEADRMRVLQSPSGAEIADGPLAHFRLFERLLPYAVIFGVEKEWLAQLRLRYDELDGLDDSTLSTVADVAETLFLVAHTLGDLSELTGALGDLVDAAGSPLDLLDLFP